MKRELITIGCHHYGYDHPFDIVINVDEWKRIHKPLSYFQRPCFNEEQKAYDAYWKVVKEIAGRPIAFTIWFVNDKGISIYPDLHGSNQLDIKYCGHEYATRGIQHYLALALFNRRGPAVRIVSLLKGGDTPLSCSILEEERKVLKNAI